MFSVIDSQSLVVVVGVLACVSVVPPAQPFRPHVTHVREMENTPCSISVKWCERLLW
jgi:hypothetical protein